MCLDKCHPPLHIYACNNHFRQYGILVAAYNCKGERKLCNLCVAAIGEVPECSTYCAEGVKSCIDDFKAGLKVLTYFVTVTFCCWPVDKLS